MHIETRTKRLARIIFLFSASSFCAILVCLTVTHRAKVSAPPTVSSPIYTYQNPFKVTANTASAVLPEAKAGGLLTNLFSAKCLLGLLGLGTLWFASVWLSPGGGKTQKQVPRQAGSTISPKMNPLAILPVNRVQKQDTFCPPVICQATISRSVAHRKSTAPCQSRFRPIALAASQTRFGRLS